MRVSVSEGRKLCRGQLSAGGKPTTCLGSVGDSAAVPGRLLVALPGSLVNKAKGNRVLIYELIDKHSKLFYGKSPPEFERNFNLRNNFSPRVTK